METSQTTCPQCGQVNHHPAEACVQCGIIFVKNPVDQDALYEQNKIATAEPGSMVEQNHLQAETDSLKNDGGAPDKSAESFMENGTQAEPEPLAEKSQTPSEEGAQAQEVQMQMNQETPIGAINTPVNSEPISTKAEEIIASDILEVPKAEQPRSATDEQPVSVSTSPHTSAVPNVEPVTVDPPGVADTSGAADTPVVKDPIQPTVDNSLQQPEVSGSAEGKSETGPVQTEKPIVEIEAAEPVEVELSVTGIAEKAEPKGTSPHAASPHEPVIALEDNLKLTAPEVTPVQSDVQAKDSDLNKQNAAQAKAEILKKQKEAQAKAEALKREKAAQAKAASLKKQKLAKAKAEALKKQKEAVERALKKHRESQAKAKALEKQKADQALAEAMKKQKEAQAKAEASAQETQATKKEALDVSQNSVGDQQNRYTKLLGLLKQYQGRAIGINYDNSSEIKEAELVRANDEFFSVKVKDKKLQYSYPLKTILTIVEGQDGVETGEAEPKSKFNAVIKVYPLVLF
jgi:hypothetical protein